jgi:hypothetical protein
MDNSIQKPGCRQKPPLYRNLVLDNFSGEGFSVKMAGRPPERPLPNKALPPPGAGSDSSVQLYVWLYIIITGNKKNPTGVEVC